MTDESDAHVAEHCQSVEAPKKDFSKSKQAKDTAFCGTCLSQVRPRPAYRARHPSFSTICCMTVKVGPRAAPDIRRRLQHNSIHQTSITGSGEMQGSQAWCKLLPSWTAAGRAHLTVSTGKVAVAASRPDTAPKAMLWPVGTVSSPVVRL